MFAATLMLALIAETALIHELDVVVRDTSGALVVVRVLSGGRGASAGLRPGQFIIRVAGERVSTIDELANALERRKTEPLDLEVSDGKPARGRMWLGASASGAAWTGQGGTRSSWLGLLLALELG